MREKQPLILSKGNPVFDSNVRSFTSFLIILFIFKLIKIINRHRTIILNGSNTSESGSMKFLKKLNINPSNVFENL